MIPERDGFLAADWRGYNEAMLLNIMALGSPTHPISTKTWEKPELVRVGELNDVAANKGTLADNPGGATNKS